MSATVQARSHPRRQARTVPLVTSEEVAELYRVAEQLQGMALPGVRVTEKQFVQRYFHPDLNVEWVNGEVFVAPPVSLDHNEMTSWLAAILREFVEHHDLGRIFATEVQTRLPEIPSRRNPDLMFIAKTNAKKLLPNHVEGAPDLAIEIVSPSSIGRDWRDKYFEYEKSGVGEYWLIDPLSRRCELYGRSRAKKFVRVTEDTQGRIHSKVLRGFYLRSEWLWQSPRPKLAGVLQELGVR